MIAFHFEFLHKLWITFSITNVVSKNKNENDLTPISLGDGQVILGIGIWCGQNNAKMRLYLSIAFLCC